MNTLLALWVCANPANLPAVNDFHGHNNNAVSCANDFSVFQHHQSSHLLYEQPTSWPVREKLNKGIVNEKCFSFMVAPEFSGNRASQKPDRVFCFLGGPGHTYHF